MVRLTQVRIPVPPIHSFSCVHSPMSTFAHSHIWTIAHSHTEKLSYLHNHIFIYSNFQGQAYSLHVRFYVLNYLGYKRRFCFAWTGFESRFHQFIIYLVYIHLCAHSHIGIFAHSYIRIVVNSGIRTIAH